MVEVKLIGMQVQVTVEVFLSEVLLVLLSEVFLLVFVGKDT